MPTGRPTVMLILLLSACLVALSYTVLYRFYFGSGNPCDHIRLDGSYNRSSSVPMFGVGYAVEGYAELMRGTGAVWVRIPLVAWGAVEPSPPEGGVHHYNWTRLDRLILEYQECGFEVQVILKCANPWAATGYERDVREVFRRSYPPREEYWDDYYQFVYSVVERYDCDGYMDAPGLLHPVRYYEIESEAHNSILWAGTVEDYRRLLETAYRAAKRAYPEVKIILSGINFGDLFDDCPSPAEVEEMIRSLPPGLKKAYNFIVESLSLGDYYDIVDLHFNRNYTGIPYAVEWVRQELAKHGYDKPIWAGDVCSVPFITDDEHRHLLDAILDPESPGHEEATRWLRAEQARLSIKKLVVSAGSGVEVFILETLRDFSMEAYRHASEESFFIAGLVDDDMEPRPAFYAYRQAIQKIEGFTRVEYCHWDGCYLYRFYFRDRSPVYIVWSDAGLTNISISGFQPGRMVKVEKLITSLPPDPEVEVVKTESGKIWVLVDDTPVFIEEYSQESSLLCYSPPRYGLPARGWPVIQGHSLLVGCLTGKF